jgi:hypothetical protein
MHYNIELGVKKIILFLLKKLFTAGMRMRWGYPNPSGMGMRLDFTSPLGMGSVTGKYMGVGYGDGKVKFVPTQSHFHA